MLKNMDFLDKGTHKIILYAQIFLKIAQYLLYCILNQNINNKYGVIGLNFSLKCIKGKEVVFFNNFLSPFVPAEVDVNYYATIWTYYWSI